MSGGTDGVEEPFAAFPMVFELCVYKHEFKHLRRRGEGLRGETLDWRGGRGVLVHEGCGSAA